MPLLDVFEGLEDRVANGIAFFLHFFVQLGVQELDGWDAVRFLVELRVVLSCVLGRSMLVQSC